MDWRYLFTRLEGRISRKPFWIASLVLLAGYIALMWNVFTIMDIPYDAVSAPDPRVALARIGISLVLLYPVVAVNVKRLHDRGRPGWLVALILAATFLLDLSDALGLSGTQQAPSPLSVVLIIAIAGLGLWFLIDLGLLKGQQGQNRYGPDPLGARQVDASF